ncbi:MAG: hypothetical protein AB7V39_17815, partial [Nitrospiraceae bacterium]
MAVWAVVGTDSAIAFDVERGRHGRPLVARRMGKGCSARGDVRITGVLANKAWSVMLRGRGAGRSVRVASAFCAVLVALQALAATAQGAGDLSVADGLKVTLEYTLSLSDQSVVDSNVGQAPFTFTQGAHEIVPGL